ncbi:MAG: hypothetical protein ACFFBS_07655 [Promethearchaeota archaeon]
MKKPSEATERNLELLREEIRTAFDENFSGKAISAFIDNNRCPYCGSFITREERLFCDFCGLYFMKDSLGNYEIPKEQRVKLCMEQEMIRLSIPQESREILHFNEWIYYYADFFKKQYRRKFRASLAGFFYWLHFGLEPFTPRTFEDVLIITSERLIRHKSGGKKEDNWIIPIEKIESVLASGIFDDEFSGIERFLPSSKDYAYSHSDLLYTYFRISFQTNRGPTYKEVKIRRHGGEHVSPEVNLWVVEEYIERARDVRRIRSGH